MADQAERSRRHRRHRAGDHSLCNPRYCDAAAAAAAAAGIPVSKPAETAAEPKPTETGRQAPTGLGPSGAELWDAVVAQCSPGPLQTQLLVEACRIADRLDLLDIQLRGGSWLRFRHDETGAEVTVYVDRVLAEAREQATALRGLVAELTKSMGAAQARPTGKAGGGVADLTARLAARRPTSTA